MTKFWSTSLLLLVPAGSAEEQTAPPPQPQCGLWMAPSTLGDATNLGMYAGVDIPEGVDIQQEIAIPLLFRNWDKPDYYDTDDGTLWDRYIWEGDVADLETYDNTDLQQTKAVFVPGIGCTINSVLDMHNVESTHGSTYDTAGLHRSKDPGSGAFSPYYGTHTVSTEMIPAGSEIFAAYGDTWIPDIPGAQVTFDKNLEAAEDFLRNDYYRFILDHKKDLTEEFLEAFWNFTRDFPVQQNQIFTVLPRKATWKEIEAVLEQKVKESSENDVAEEEYDGAVNTANDDPDEYEAENMVTRHFIRQQSRKSLEWLQRYGRCCDHMVAKKSTIPQAGRGAFATRDLPQGTIVGYSPLIHVGMEGEKLYTIPYGNKDPKWEPLYDEEGNKLPTPPEDEGYELKDLVINYSFGHRDTTLLLTPYGSMVNFINHQSDGKANVKVVWPKEDMVAHKPEWLERNLTTIRWTMEKIGLSFDYVALRDIKEGEEIFMDYGPEWESAWREHVIDWEPLEGALDYVHSSEWPHDEPLRTEAEQETNPYPDNLETMCVESYRTDPKTKRKVWVQVLRKSQARIPCSILDRHPKLRDPTYRVELIVGEDETTGEEKTIIIERVPHDSIYLVDRVKTADWHMPNAFRHYIQIPDDVLPEVWKNRKTETKEHSQPINIPAVDLPEEQPSDPVSDEL